MLVQYNQDVQIIYTQGVVLLLHVAILEPILPHDVTHIVVRLSLQDVIQDVIVPDARRPHQQVTIGTGVVMLQRGSHRRLATKQYRMYEAVQAVASIVRGLIKPHLENVSENIL